MGDGAQETTAPLRLNGLLKGRFATTKEAKELLSDIGLLATGYCLTILKELGREVTEEDVDAIFSSLKSLDP